MRIEIDTKEDLHNIHHIIKLLHAISGKSSNYDDSLFTPSSQSTSQPTPEASASLFNMFDSGPSSSSSSSSLPQPGAFPSIFDEKKSDEDKKDFLDSLQVY